MNHSYSIQLYSVRDVAQNSLKNAIDAVASYGYSQVEFAGFFGHSAEEVRAMLDEAKLTCSGTHTGWMELRPSVILDTIAYHKTIGNTRIIIPGADLSTREKIDQFVALVNYAQPILASEGISLGFHNHSSEFQVMPWGLTIHAELQYRTALAFEIDTYWAYNADCDPLQILERLKDRIHVIHLKDGLKGGVGKTLGAGEAPVKAVRDLADRLGFTCVVESETLMPDGLSEAKACMEYLRSID